MGNENPAAPSAVCSVCGGTLELDEAKDAYVCAYCGASYPVASVSNESDQVRVEKIKAQTQKDLETQKMQAQKDLETQRMQTQKELEAERLRAQAEASKQQDTKEKSEAFKRSGLKIFLILFAILAGSLCVMSFREGKAMPGIIAAAIVVLCIVAFLMGMGTIGEKRHNLRLVPTFIAIALLVPYSMLGGCSVTQKSEPISWDDIVLGDVLPKPASDKGSITMNSDSKLSVDIDNTSESDYRDYIDQCKAKGFTVDAQTDTSSYSAYDDKGYSLNLYYYESSSRMSISLDAPVEMKEGQWPTSDLAKMLPTPKSTSGSLSWEHSDGFLYLAGSTTKSDYDDYVKACSDMGFKEDLNKGEAYYYADNAQGYHLSLSYEGNDTMTIKLEKGNSAGTTKASSSSAKSKSAASSSKSSNAAASAKSSSETASAKDASAAAASVAATTAPAATAPAATATSAAVDENGVTVSFKEAMDSYEAFFDEYVAFMKKYNDSSDTVGMLSDYTSFMSQYADTMQKLNDVDTDNLSEADYAYYVEVDTRILQKLAEVNQ